MTSAVKPPEGWIALPATASEEHKKYWNLFLEQWEQHKSQFPQDEDAWKKISLKLQKGRSCKLFNHYIAKKEAPKNLTWGHLVAAIILFGKTTVVGSTFGQRIQEKYPQSDITTMKYNTSGPTLDATGKTILTRRRTLRHDESEVKEEDEIEEEEEPQEQEDEEDQDYTVSEEAELSISVSQQPTRHSTNPPITLPRSTIWRTGNIFTAAPLDNSTNRHSQSPHPRQGTTRSRGSATQARRESTIHFRPGSSSEQPRAETQSNKPRGSGPRNNTESPPQEDSTINVLTGPGLDTDINIAQEESNSNLEQASHHPVINTSPDNSTNDGCDGIYLFEDAAADAAAAAAAANTTTRNTPLENSFAGNIFTHAEFTTSTATDNESQNSRFRGPVFSPRTWNVITGKKRKIDQVGDNITPRPSPRPQATWGSSISRQSSTHVSTPVETVDANLEELSHHTEALGRILKRYHQLSGYAIPLDGPEQELTKLRDKSAKILSNIDAWGLELTISKKRAMAEIESLREVNQKLEKKNRDLEWASTMTQAKADKAHDKLVEQFAQHLSDSRTEFDGFRQDVQKSLEESEGKSSRSLQEKLESLEAQMNTSATTLMEDRAREEQITRRKLERLEAMLERSNKNNRQLEKKLSGLTGIVADIGAATDVVRTEQQWNSALEKYGLQE
ncbi:hypothetical protein SNK05_001919 [Fusarium graminearum]|nr:hypothetical protein FG05_01663 [Fusarium graminearum]